MESLAGVPAGGTLVTVLPPAVPPCVLCDERWPSSGAETYQDPLGFSYALCAPHKTGLVEGLRRIATRRMTRALAQALVRRVGSRGTRGKRKTTGRRGG